MFLLDTNVVSERCKGAKANPGVVDFIERTEQQFFLPVQVVGELRQGIEKLKQKGDPPQALRVESWLQSILADYGLRILDFDLQCAKTWGTLMGFNDQHIVDKQIAAIALVYGLTVATRNTDDFAGTGIRLFNPFLGYSSSTPEVEVQ